MSIQEARRAAFEAAEQDKDWSVTCDMSTFNGKYNDDARQDRWITWNAALDSVCVHLQESRNNGLYKSGWDDAIIHAEEAIETAGIQCEVAK